MTVYEVEGEPQYLHVRTMRQGNATDDELIGAAKILLDGSWTEFDGTVAALRTRNFGLQNYTAYSSDRDRVGGDQGGRQISGRGLPRADLVSSRKPPSESFAVYYAAAIRAMPTDPGSLSIATILAYSDMPHVSIRRLASLAHPQTRAGLRPPRRSLPTDLLELTLSLETAQRTSTLPARPALHGLQSLHRKTRRIPAYTPDDYLYRANQTRL